MLPIWTLGETSQRFCPCPEGPARRRREPLRCAQGRLLRARVVAEPVLQHTGTSPTTSTAALAVRKTSCYHACTCEVAAESRGAKALRLSLVCLSELVATQQHDVRCLIQDMGTICILCIRYGAEVWHGTEGAEDTEHRP